MTAKRVDANQPQLTKELRKLGFGVAITSDLGKGFPDIAVGFGNALNLLIEIKTNEKKKLTEHEQKFFDTWKGQVDKSCTTLEIIDAVIETLQIIVEDSEIMFLNLAEIREKHVRELHI